ncbi:MAG TPA: hypothetical protein ENK02_07615 [Planctomycetes bacterium]|nr:hypothetical protein [Planctomycetota bacterium]
MEKTIPSQSQYTRRHLSQMKVLARLLEHEMELAKGGDLTLDRDLADSLLDVLEIYIEDVEAGYSAKQTGGKGDRKVLNPGEKPQVTRL